MTGHGCDPADGPAAAGGADATTLDAFLGGRVMAAQPRTGYRAGLDAVLLAAAVPAAARILDAGAGVGVAGLCVAARQAGAHVTLVERDGGLARLAAANVARNGLGGRVRVIEADVTAASADLAQAGLGVGGFDEVLANPPYQVAGRGRTPADPLKAGAHEMSAGALDRWVRFAVRMAATGGGLTMIHRADALAMVLDALAGRFGALSILPIHPREGEPAIRILVAGRKASRARLVIRDRLVLHGADGSFLPAVAAVLREGAPLVAPE